MEFRFQGGLRDFGRIAGPERGSAPLFAALLVCIIGGTAFAADQRSSLPDKDLPAVFTRPAPTSIADLQAIQNHVKDLVKKVSPAVVSVEIGFGNGSGVIISSNGLVLTAGHVVEKANRDVRFTFPDGKTARGKTIGIAEDSDAGLIRITDKGPWPYLKTSDLTHARVGNWVLALGHPGGFDPKRSLVVRLGRIIRLDSERVQTDCTISPGDSGGPLFDMRGNIIGIHSFITSAMSDNFHVPTTSFSEEIERLTKTAKKK